MVLDEFLIALGVKADTRGLTDTAKGLGDVETQAKKTDSSLSGFSEKLGGFIKGFSLFSTAAIGSIQTIVVGAWAYLSSTIDKVEELQTAEYASIRTTKEQVEMAKKYRENMGLMGKTIDSVKTRIALGFLPTMFELSKTYSEFLNANKELISDGISKLLEWMSSASQVFTNFIRFMVKLVENTVGWKGALIGLVAILAIVKKATIAAFIANPITWVVAAIAGLLLIIDDFMTYLDGGESQFGEFWGGLLKWIEKAKEIWSGFSDTAKGGFKTLAIGFALLMPMLGGFIGTLKTTASVIGLVGKAMAMTPIGRIITLVGLLVYVIIDLIKWLNGGESQFSALWEAVANVWNKIVDWTSRAIEKMANAVKKFIDDVSDFFGGVFDAIVNPFKEAFDWVSNKWQGLKNMFSSGVNANINMSDRIGGSGVTTNSNRVVNNNINSNSTFNVNGARDPNVTANTILNYNKTTQMNFGGVAKA